MKQCIKCRQQIPLDCKECTFCGQIQPVEKTDCEINNDELEKAGKRKRKKMVVVFLSFFALIVVSTVALIIATLNLESETPSYSYVESSTVDNSVNGMGYYYFDNSMETAISKYRQISEHTDTSSLVNAIDNITEDSFSKETMLFYNSEEVVQNYYEYYNGDTAVAIFTNTNGEIPAFSYLYTSSLTSSFNYETQAQIEQLIYKPAKWLYALSETLTYEEAVEIYKTLYSKHLEAIEAKKSGESYNIAHYYKGYSLLVNGSDSAEVITVLKTDSDFVDDIKVGDESLFQPIKTTTEPTTVQVKTVEKENMVIESDNDLGYTFNMDLDEFCTLFNNADDAIGLGSEYDIIQSNLIHTNESELFYGKPHTLYTSSSTKVGGMSIAVENESKNVSRFQACITGDAYGTDNTEKIKLNRTKSMIKMLNPNLDNSEIQSLAEQLFNSDDIDTNQNRYLYYNNVGYSINEIAGGIWITAEPMTKEYYNSRISDSSENRVSFGDYSLVLPDDWTYVDDGYGNITFYEKYNYTNNTDILGVLISIEKWSTPVGDDYHFQYENLGQKNGYFYYAFWPSGIGISNDQTANEKYESARAEIASVLDSFEFN